MDATVYILFFCIKWGLAVSMFVYPYFMIAEFWGGKDNVFRTPFRVITIIIYAIALSYLWDLFRW